MFCSLCQQSGGSSASLASVHSYEENWYIKEKVIEYNYDDFYDPDVWIGMSKYAYGKTDLLYIRTLCSKLGLPDQLISIFRLCGA